jgi:hypothetical protein
MITKIEKIMVSPRFLKIMQIEEMGQPTSGESKSDLDEV